MTLSLFRFACFSFCKTVPRTIIIVTADDKSASHNSTTVHKIVDVIETSTGFYDLQRMSHLNNNHCNDNMAATYLTW